MGRILLIRFLRLFVTLLAVTFLSFIMVELLDGSPALAILGTEGIQDTEAVAALEAELGLNRSWPVRYVDWLGSLAQGDLGESYVQRGIEVSDIIKTRLPVTAQLATMAILLAVVLAVPIGVLGAYQQGRIGDKFSSAVAQVFLSVPNFIIGIFLIWFLSVRFNLLPVGNWNRISDGLGPNLQSAIMPSVALAMTQMAIFSRLIRSDMIATLKENYILAARAKGLSDRFILLRHALRPSSLSLATLIGINFGALLGGTVVIEFLFGLPGLGTRLLTAINQRDILVIQGITVFIAVVYVVINTLVDLFYTVLDPRIRRS